MNGDGRVLRPRFRIVLAPLGDKSVCFDGPSGPVEAGNDQFTIMLGVADPDRISSDEPVVVVSDVEVFERINSAGK